MKINQLGISAAILNEISRQAIQADEPEPTVSDAAIKAIIEAANIVVESMLSDPPKRGG